MQYIGERELVVEEIISYDSVNGREEKFLWEKGLLMEYALSNYCEPRTLSRKEKESLLYIFNMTKRELQGDGEIKTLEYKGEKYLEVKWHDSHFTHIFKVLPKVFDDETFSWKNNKRYGVMETTINLDNFEFCCVYNTENGDASIDVKYTKCDNRHHNKVTITTITVNDATNKAILEAIKYWKKRFMEDLELNIPGEKRH